MTVPAAAGHPREGAQGRVGRQIHASRVQVVMERRSRKATNIIERRPKPFRSLALHDTSFIFDCSLMATRGLLAKKFNKLPVDFLYGSMKKMRGSLRVTAHMDRNSLC